MKLGAFDVGPDRPFFLIAGPCVIESETMIIEVAGRLRDMTSTLGIPFVFKASFDKANRSSSASFRGPGLEAGLKALAQVRKQIGVPILTDVHEDTPLAEVAEVVDVPADACIVEPPDEFHRQRVFAEQTREHQEGTVPVAVGNAKCRGQGQVHRQHPDHGVRTWIFVRLQQSRVRHAFVVRDARHRVPRGVRTPRIRSSSRAARDMRRADSARIRTGARPRCRGGRRCRHLHGNAS